MKVLRILLGLFCVAVIAAILFPVQSHGGRAVKTACLSNVKQQVLGLIMYSSDSDDHFPAKERWMDIDRSYVKFDGVFRCPTMPKDTYGYAFNAALSRVKVTSKMPTTTVAIFESSKSERNASDALTSLPVPGRHDGKNSIGYIDGHVKRVVSE